MLIGPGMRSHPNLLDRAQSALVVVDVQEAFRGYVAGFDSIVAQIRLLAAGAARLGVPIAWSEQYPSGLGSTVPELAGEIHPSVGTTFDKLAFAAPLAPSWNKLPERLRDARQYVVVGIEAHVCVRQTALALRAAGCEVHVPVDAVASHTEQHRDVALAALDQAGVHLATVEQVLFDWLREAGTPEFKDVQALLKAAAAD
jgi:nicotinamidase-related amidase